MVKAAELNAMELVSMSSMAKRSLTRPAGNVSEVGKSFVKSSSGMLGKGSPLIWEYEIIFEPKGWYYSDMILPRTQSVTVVLQKLLHLKLSSYSLKWKHKYGGKVLSLKTTKNTCRFLSASHILVLLWMRWKHKFEYLRMCSVSHVSVHVFSWKHEIKCTLHIPRQLILMAGESYFSSSWQRRDGSWDADVHILRRHLSSYLGFVKLNCISVVVGSQFRPDILGFIVFHWWYPSFVVFLEHRRLLRWI